LALRRTVAIKQAVRESGCAGVSALMQALATSDPSFDKNQNWLIVA